MTADAGVGPMVVVDVQPSRETPTDGRPRGEHRGEADSLVMVTSQRVLSQMRKGILEFCVLARLEGGPAYGLELATTLGHNRHLFSSEGTLYPLLARLRKQGWVQTSWQESAGGPPRRYYELTSEGTATLELFRTTWTELRQAVDAALEGTPS
jgi:PadR family transcriptional regulator PadR